MVFGGRVAVFEGDIIFVLCNYSRSTVCCCESAAHLEDDVETLLRRCPAEDALCHRFANIRRGGPEARHDEREGGNPASYNKKKRGKPRIIYAQL